MLRMIFVLTIILVGAFFAAMGPFQGLLFYMWNAYFRPDHWAYGEFIMSLNLSLIIGVYVVIRTLMARPNLKISLGTFLIWAFFAQCISSTIQSENPLFSQMALDIFARVMVITYVIVVLVTDRSKFRLVILVMCLSLGFELAKQGWADLWRSPGRVNMNQVAFLGDNNGVAMGLLMLFALFGSLIQTTPRRWEKNLLRFMAVGVLLRAISTYSRGGFLGAFALVGISVLRAEKKLRAIVIVALLGAVVWNVMPEGFWNRMDTIQVEEDEQRDESSAGRLHFWSVAVEMANAKPITGVGFGVFNLAYTRYNTNPRFEGERSAHSVWFGTLGDLGYLGLGLLIANLAMAFWSCWRVHRLARKRPALRELRIYANAIISALVVFCVSGSFLSSQYNEMAWHLIGLSIALRHIAFDEARAVDLAASEQPQAA